MDIVVVKLNDLFPDRSEKVASILCYLANDDPKTCNYVTILANTPNDEVFVKIVDNIYAEKLDSSTKNPGPFNTNTFNPPPFKCQEPSPPPTLNNPNN